MRLASVGLAGACLLTLFAACRGKGGPGAGDGLKYLPADTDLVLNVNVTRLRPTQFVNRLLAMRDRSQSLRERWNQLVKKTGFDPLRDLDAITVGLPYRPEPQPEVGVVLLGRFNPPAIVGWLKEIAKEDGSAVKEEKVGGRTVYFETDGGYHAVFVNSTTLIVGSQGWIRRALDLADGKGQTVRSQPKMAELIGRLRPNQSVWGVARFPEDASKRDDDSPLKGLSAVLGTIDFAAGLEVDFRADTSSDAQAKDLSDKFNQAVKELRDSPLLGNMGFAPMLADVKSTTEGKVLHGRALLPQQQLDELIKKLDELVKDRLGDMPLRLPSRPEGDAQLDSNRAPLPASRPSAAARGADTDMNLPPLRLAPSGGPKKQRKGLLDN